MAPAPAAAFWEQEGKLFEYPPELVIRNTFIDAKVARSPSLDDFFVERRVRSCPSSEIKNVGCDDEEEAVNSTSSDEFTPKGEKERKGTASTSASGGSVCEELEGSSMKSWRVDDDMDGCPPETMQASRPFFLDLGSILPEFENSQIAGPEKMYIDGYSTHRTDATSAEGPFTDSAGSAFHPHTCKPCAFYHTKGCESGADCQFCHTCGPHEKESRRNDKKKAIKAKNQTLRMLSQMAQQGMMQPLPMASGFLYY